MAEKLYRVRRLETRYFYLDVEAENHEDAEEKVLDMCPKDKDWLPEDKEEDIHWEQADTYELGKSCYTYDMHGSKETEPTESLLSSLEDITDQLGREKITEESAIQLIHNISDYYRGRK